MERNNIILNLGGTKPIYYDVYSDLNDVPINKQIICGSVINSDRVANLPKNFGGMYMLIPGDSSKHLAWMFYVTHEGNSQELYFRYKWDTWYAWKKITQS